MIGNTFGHYRILDKLGAGGMDVACRVENTNHKLRSTKFIHPLGYHNKS